MKFRLLKTGNLPEDEGKEPKEIECEREIRAERDQYDFVSTIFMRYLRERYGHDIANRALWRSQKRKKQNKDEQKKTPLEKIVEQFKDVTL